MLGKMLAGIGEDCTPGEVVTGTESGSGPGMRLRQRGASGLVCEPDASSVRDATPGMGS